MLIALCRWRLLVCFRGHPTSVLSCPPGRGAFELLLEAVTDAQECFLYFVLSWFLTLPSEVEDAWHGCQYLFHMGFPTLLGIPQEQRQSDSLSCSVPGVVCTCPSYWHSENTTFDSLEPKFKSQHGRTLQ